MSNFINKVYKVVYDGATVTFIIQTEGESDFWHWSVYRQEVIEYFQTRKNPAAVFQVAVDKLSKVNCNRFVNDLDNNLLGSSCGSFKTVKAALHDLGVI